jgi:phage/plasmid-like protein (TIGR03299 family)
MSHEIEDNNAFYVSKPAWHGLGTVLDAPPTVEDAIRIAGLDWHVGLEPVYLADGRVAPAKATVRSSDQSVLGVVGPTYKPLQNLEAFNWFNPFIDAGEATLEAAGSLRNGKRIWVLAKIGRDLDVSGGDVVRQYILLSNGHDGTLAVRVGYTPTRVVCANTLAVAHQGPNLIRVRHRGDIVGTLEDIRDTMQLARQTFEATTEQYRVLANSSINRQDLETYIKRVFQAPKAPANDNTGDRLLASIVPLFESGRGQDLKAARGTYWGAYNAVTEYLTHERGRSEEVRLDSQWFGQGATLNTKALSVAMEMAA